MNIAEAFGRLRNDDAAMARRSCWDIRAFVFPSVEIGQDGSALVMLTRDDVDDIWPFVPHSTDMNAEDWETYD